MTSDTHSYSTTHIQSFSSHEIVDLLDPPAYLKVIKFTKFGDPGFILFDLSCGNTSGRGYERHHDLAPLHGRQRRCHR